MSSNMPVTATLQPSEPPFEFFKLPAEIRLQMYDHIAWDRHYYMGPPLVQGHGVGFSQSLVPVMDWAELTWAGDHPYVIWRSGRAGRSNINIPTLPFHAFLLTCRKAYCEATVRFWEKVTTIVFKDISTLRKFILCVTVSARYLHKIRHILVYSQHQWRAVHGGLEVAHEMNTGDRIPVHKLQLTASILGDVGEWMTEVINLVNRDGNSVRKRPVYVVWPGDIVLDMVKED